MVPLLYHSLIKIVAIIPDYLIIQGYFFVKPELLLIT